MASQLRTPGDSGEAYGAFLRRRRLEKRFTQREFGAKVGVDFTYLSKVENGRLPPPSEATISQIAKVLGDSADDHLAQARKVPLDLRATFAELPMEAAMLLRELRSKPVPQKAYADMLRTLRAAKTTAPGKTQRRPRA